MRQPDGPGGGGSHSAAALLGARLIAALPLVVAQALGAALARIAVRFARRERERLHANLGIAGYGDDARLARAAVREAGKTLLELPWVWLRPVDEVLARVRSVEGIEHVRAAHARGNGIVFLTPHLGCFEVAAQFAGSHGPITVMFRPPRQPALRPLFETGRRRGNVALVPANTRGATALLAALRRGDWVGILPDSVPTGGEGEWAPFFGRPAFTMTLATRLIERTGASALMRGVRAASPGAGLDDPDRAAGAAGARRVRDRGHEPRAGSGDPPAARAVPVSYHRYRTPAGAAPPAGAAGS